MSPRLAGDHKKKQKKKTGLHSDLEQGYFAYSPCQWEAIFAFSAKICLKSAKNRGILHTLHANGRLKLYPARLLATLLTEYETKVQEALLIKKLNSKVNKELYAKVSGNAFGSGAVGWRFNS